MRLHTSRGVSDVATILTTSAAVLAIFAALYFQSKFQDTLDETKEVRDEANALTEDITAVSQYGNQMAAVAGWPTSADQPDPEPGNPEAFLSGRAQAYDQPANYGSLQSVVMLASRRSVDARVALGRAKAEKARAQKALTSAQGRKTTVIDAKDRHIDDITREESELRSRSEDQTNAFRDREDALQRTLDGVSEEQRKVEEQQRKTVLETQNEILRLEGTLKDLLRREEVVRDTIEIRGNILEPDPLGRFAYIDIGEGKRLVPGMKFRVLRPAKAGKYTAIGLVEVKRILPNLSEVSISKTYDRFAPIQEGDLIANPLYHARGAIHVALAGRFGSGTHGFSKEEALRRLGRMDVIVDSPITLTTDYLLIGSDYKDDELYQQAVDLGVPTLPAIDAFEFLEE